VTECPGCEQQLEKETKNQQKSGKESAKSNEKAQPVVQNAHKAPVQQSAWSQGPQNSQPQGVKNSERENPHQQRNTQKPSRSPEGLLKGAINIDQNYEDALAIYSHILLEEVKSIAQNSTLNNSDKLKYIKMTLQENDSHFLHRKNSRRSSRRSPHPN
jgi:hypothetical protein